MSVVRASFARYHKPTLLYPSQPAQDPESRLAAGDRLTLEGIGIWELELLPDISDTLARRILQLRPDIIAEASTLLEVDRGHALEQIRGVGGKKAEELAKHLGIGPENKPLP